MSRVPQSKKYTSAVSDPFLAVANRFDMSVQMVDNHAKLYLTRNQIDPATYTMLNQVVLFMNTVNSSLGDAKFSTTTAGEWNQKMELFLGQLTTLKTDLAGVQKSWVALTNEALSSVKQVDPLNNNIMMVIAKATTSGTDIQRSNASLLTSIIAVLRGAYPAISATFNDPTMASLVDEATDQNRAVATSEYDPTTIVLGYPLRSSPSSIAPSGARFSLKNDLGTDAVFSTTSAVNVFFLDGSFFVIFARASQSNGTSIPIANIGAGKFKVTLHRQKNATTGFRYALTADKVVFPYPTSATIPTGFTDDDKSTLTFGNVWVGSTAENRSVLVVSNDANLVMNVVNNSGTTSNMFMVVQIDPLPSTDGSNVLSYVGSPANGIPPNVADLDVLLSIKNYISQINGHWIYEYMDQVWRSVAQNPTATFKLENGSASSPQLGRASTDRLFSDYYAEMLFENDFWFNEVPGTISLPGISPVNMVAMYPYFFNALRKITAEIKSYYNSNDRSTD